MKDEMGTRRHCVWVCPYIIPGNESDLEGMQRTAIMILIGDKMSRVKCESTS